MQILRGWRWVPEPKISVSLLMASVTHPNNPRRLADETAVSTASSGWFLSHWRGETSLGLAYWLNGILLGSLLPSLVLIAYSQIDPFRRSLRVNAFVLLVLTVLKFGIWIWVTVGIIRSANRHTSRGGSLFWANAARVMICVSLVVTAVRLHGTDIPAVRLMAALVSGHDPMNKVTVETTADGRTITLEGTMGEGSVEQVQKALDASPEATTLILNSDGGRALVAEELARRVRKRHINTLVQDHCLSACTFVFLAGVKRELDDDADLGFHQPSSEGYLSSQGQRAMIQSMVEYYRSVGVRESFIDRVIETPSDDMWYPTRSELEEARVLTKESTT
jgi:hypothetical protein